MTDYLIILGREPELAVAEISCVARRLAMPWQWQMIEREVALGRGDLSERFLSALAGTVKVAEVLGQVKSEKEAVVEFIYKHLPDNGRCEFGLSWYGAKPPRWLTAAGLTVKKRLKSEDRHVRYVTSRTPALSSVVVAKNKLLPANGYEFVLFLRGNELMVGRTIWVQDFASWSERDYGRPERDARVGMLPPKLARIMINLAEAPEGAGILDPFCGSGTVLQEAALLGYRHLVGTDADSQGIERTRANFSWLKQKNPQTPAPALMVADIKNLISILHQSNFDCIVTEPYLGPPLRGHESEQRLGQIAEELTEFYRSALRVMVRVIKPGGRIVMIWPAWRAGRKNLFLPLVNELASLGLKQVSLIPAQIPSSWLNQRDTLWYYRPDARIIREIVVLEKQ